MAVTIRNIIVGAGNMYVSSADNAKTPLSAAPGAGTSYNVALSADPAWRSVGGTTNGVEVTFTPTFGEVAVDQLKDAAILFNQGVVINMNTTLSEASLSNLLIAWGYASTALVNAGDTLNLGVPGDSPVERSAALVGKAPATAALAARERVYLARRVISMAASNHTLRRTEATNFPISFRLLPDPTYSGSEYGTILDRTI
jgi:hypothetical protein